MKYRQLSDSLRRNTVGLMLETEQLERNIVFWRIAEVKAHSGKNSFKRKDYLLEVMRLRCFSGQKESPK
jgi:hypothetical protein